MLSIWRTPRRNLSTDTTGPVHLPEPPVTPRMCIGLPGVVYRTDRLHLLHFCTLCFTEVWWAKLSRNICQPKLDISTTYYVAKTFTPRNVPNSVSASYLSVFRTSRPCRKNRKRLISPDALIIPFQDQIRKDLELTTAWSCLTRVGIRLKPPETAWTSEVPTWTPLNRLLRPEDAWKRLKFRFFRHDSVLWNFPLGGQLRSVSETIGRKYMYWASTCKLLL